MAAVRFDYFVADDFGVVPLWPGCLGDLFQDIVGRRASKIRRGSIQFRAASIWARSWSGMIGTFWTF